MLIDTHAHLLSEYYDNLEELLYKLRNMIVINCASNKQDNDEVFGLCQKHTNLYGTCGIHPHSIEAWSEEMADEICKRLKNKRIVAVGEIGLDFFRGNNKKEQIEVFQKQLKIAKKHNKPVIIHSRNSFEETYKILAEYPSLKKVIHCYDYGVEEAVMFVKINCRLGINGILTFPNNRQKEVVKEIDLKHLLVETDSPYLAPIPFRGQKNDSAKLIVVIEKIAEIKGISLEVTKQTLNENAIEQFDLII